MLEMASLISEMARTVYEREILVNESSVSFVDAFKLPRSSSERVLTTTKVTLSNVTSNLFDLSSN